LAIYDWLASAFANQEPYIGYFANQGTILNIGWLANIAKRETPLYFTVIELKTLQSFFSCSSVLLYPNTVI